MITDKQAHDELRTKFEQWVESDGPLPCGGIKKQRTSGGGYSLQAYNYAWEAWKASAAGTLNVPPVAWTDAEELRDLAKDGCGAMLSIGNCKGADPRRQILLFTRPAPLRDTERQELKQRIAELEIELSVKDAAIIELRQQYSRLQEARYDTSCRTPSPAQDNC